MEKVIVFDHVKKNYGNSRVLDDLSFAVESGEFITMIGRSGCGKTTALKLINGLVSPDSGSVLVHGQCVASSDQNELRRKIGYSIQNVGLFPHMTIAENISYVPSISKLEGWKGEEGRAKVSSLLESVSLDPAIAARYPRSLSGGQKQRVGIARALAASPDILLMDEPFGAVDEITREALQDQLLQIHSSRKVTIMFVTHDISEALKLGTRTMVLKDGHIEQFERPSLILSSPASDFVHELVTKGRELTVRC